MAKLIEYNLDFKQDVDVNPDEQDIYPGLAQDINLRLMKGKGKETSSHAQSGSSSKTGVRS